MWLVLTRRQKKGNEKSWFSRSLRALGGRMREGGWACVLSWALPLQTPATSKRPQQLQSGRCHFKSWPTQSTMRDFSHIRAYFLPVILHEFSVCGSRSKIPRVCLDSEAQCGFVLYENIIWVEGGSQYKKETANTQSTKWLRFNWISQFSLDTVSQWLIWASCFDTFFISAKITSNLQRLCRKYCIITSTV